MRKLPPLTELRAFEAAARHLSFKHAAGELGVTPTAISHQIKLLEQHCGRPLFRRRPRPLALTSAGRQLFPVVRDGFGRFAETLSNIKSSHAGRHLRITATNAFAARWLLPRLQSWRAAHPRLKLDIVGTDAVLNLESDETDVAIRYALGPPADGNVVELMRDTFYVVASPKLVDTRATKMRLVDLARLPLIEAAWPPGDTHAPTWQRWQRAALPLSKRKLASLVSLRFQEELHAIEAAIAGQGVAICSDVLVAPELASGVLVPVSPVTLSGYGFYIVHRAGAGNSPTIRKFITWARAEV
ncbi:LysR family transcriptional regulator [Bradyrhizobium sp. CW9]|nr:LysR family transcriptional regulator [Bradyrhizobium sp. CW9]MCK1629046.1 LysR family transcriptional regulator [Bradyrhizobium sp. 162]MCK1699017.1 LysR family transcriptional regulator [Bradyrhizobium sp. 144]